jgi:twitching motility protein PilI
MGDTAPFQLLLEIAARARSGNDAAESRLRVQPHWSGVGFSLMGQRFVAPIGSVTEVLMLPPLTRLPRVAPWLRGVANVRGRLLPVIALANFLGGRPSIDWHAHRALVVENDEFHCALVVDDVHGLQHFTAESFRDLATDIEPAMAPFVSGSYSAAEGAWAVFRPELLTRDPRFLDAAT